MALMERVSEALGVELSTVVSLDRGLVTAGLRTKGGRGLAAARMTPRDAAHLIIAVVAGPQVAESAQTVRAYAGLKLEGREWPKGIPGLGGLGDGHTFGDALTALIEGVMIDLFRPLHSPEFDVALTGREPGAEIEFRANGTTTARRYAPHRLARGSPGDLRTRQSFSQITIAEVGELLRT